MIIRKEIELKYRPRDKIPGGFYWFSEETFRKFMDELINRSNAYLVKGLPPRDKYDMITLLSVSASDVIGSISDYTESKLIVNLNSDKINEGLLELILKDKLQVTPALLVLNKNETTREILDARAICFELSVPRLQKH